MLKKITEPQAIYSKAPAPGQPAHSSLTTPPKKSSKFNWKIASAVVTVSLVAIVGVAGVLIAQRQQNNQAPVAPNAPESVPQAAVETDKCSVSFEVKPLVSPTPTPVPSVSNGRCVGKEALKIVNTQTSTPLLPNAVVIPGDVIEFKLVVTQPLDQNKRHAKVDITETLSPQLEYIDGSSKMGPTTYNKTTNKITISLPAGTTTASSEKRIIGTYRVRVKTTATGAAITNNTTLITSGNAATADNSCKFNLRMDVPLTGIGICESKVAVNPVTKKAYTTSGTVVSSVKRGDTIEYQLTVSAEKSTKDVISVRDTLPAHVSFVKGSATGVTAQPTEGTANGKKTLEFKLGKMATNGVKQTIKISYKVTVNADAPISNFTNAAEVITGIDVLGSKKCSATLTVAPVGVAQCTDKSTLSSTGSVIADESVVKKGDVITYRIKVTASETTSGAVVVTDVLPTSVTYDSAVTAGTTYNASNRTVTANLGIMGATTATKEKIIDFKVKVNENAPSGDFVNKATVTTAGGNSNSCPATLRIAYACDVSCVTDAQCASSGNSNLICSQEAGNKCRLASNTSSASCAGTSTSYSCNSSCENNEQCASSGNSNLICEPTSEGNRCRHKDYTTRASCDAPPGTSTPTPTPAIGCNDSCTSNADCTNPSHICYNTSEGTQQCRLDTNPASNTCSTPSTPVASQPELPQELPQTGPEDWVNWLKAGLITLGIGAALLLLL